MGALEPGGGAGAGAVAAVSPLARMWRTVYQKAAAVAEARAVELLKQHVYVYPHGAGGGGGGGLVELGRAVAAAGQQDLRVPATGALPTGYSGLFIMGTGRNNHTTVTQNIDVFLFYNDEVDGTKYTYSYTTTTAFSTATGNTAGAGGNTTAGAINVGLAPPYDPAGPQAVWGLSGWVPLHEAAGLPKAGQFLSGGQRGQAGELPITRTITGVYTPNPAAPITSATLRCLSPYWRAGATFIVYGLGGA